MLWIDLLRVFVPGLVLGLIIGKLLIRKPHYLSLINPAHWFKKIKKASKNKIIRIISLSFVFGIIIFFLESKLGAILANIFGPLLTDQNVFTGIAQFYFPLFILAITLIPIFEEWIFRGILLEEISKWSQSKMAGLVFSSLLFAFFHLSNPGTNASAIPLYFTGGLIIGGVYLYGGLAVAILSHIVYNLSPILFFYF